MEKALTELRELLQTEFNLEQQIAMLKVHKDAILKRIEPKMKSDILSTEFCSISKDFRAEPLTEKALKFYCDVPKPRINKTKVREALDLGLDLSKDVKITPFLFVRKKKGGLS